jgi:ABC-type branched-subunit amino acid transport system substrate-binding protein
MTNWTTRLVFLLFALGAQAQQPILVGAVVSQSGPQAPLAAGYAQGLQLWLAEVNAAGGLLGRPVELRLLDDGSDAVRTAEL